MRHVPRNAVINANDVNHDGKPFGAAILANGKVLLLGPLRLLAGATAWVLMMILCIPLVTTGPWSKGYAFQSSVSMEDTSRLVRIRVPLLVMLPKRSRHTQHEGRGEHDGKSARLG